jgi:MinD superfamily P-loop ATPase
VTQLTKCDACGKLSNQDPWVTVAGQKYIRVTVDYGTGACHTYDFCSYACVRKGVDRFEQAKGELIEARLKRFEAAQAP